MKKTVVINVVGLTKRLIGEHTPFIESFLKKGKSAYIHPVVPAVTCSVQSTYLTGKLPSEQSLEIDVSKEKIDASKRILRNTKSRGLFIPLMKSKVQIQKQ